MSRIATACPASPNPRRKKTLAWHRVFLGMLPKIIRYATIAFRGYGPEAKQEAVQNVVANTCVAVATLAKRGKLDLAYPSVLRGSALLRRRTTASSAAISMSKTCFRRTAKRRRTSGSSGSTSTTACASVGTTPRTAVMNCLRKAGPPRPRTLPPAASTSSRGSNPFRCVIAASPSTSVWATAPATPRRSSRSRPAASARFARSCPRTGSGSSVTRKVPRPSRSESTRPPLLPTISVPGPLLLSCPGHGRRKRLANILRTSASGGFLEPR